VLNSRYFKGLAASRGVNRVFAITQWTRGGLSCSSVASGSNNVGRNNVLVSRLGDQTVEVITAYTLQGRQLSIHDNSGDHDDNGVIKNKNLSNTRKKRVLRLREKNCWGKRGVSEICFTICTNRLILLKPQRVRRVGIVT
jgi:hypothetical protein